MPLTQAQGLLLSNDLLLAKFIEDQVFVTQLAGIFPFKEIFGDRERFSLAPALPAAGSFGFGGAPIPEQTTVPTSREYPFGILGTARIVNYATQDLQSNVNDQTAVQIDEAARQLHYGFWTQFITGNPAVPTQFQGLDNIIGQPAFAGQILDKGGTPVTTVDLDRALKGVRADENDVTAVYTSGDGVVAIHEAFISRGVYLPSESFPSMNAIGRRALVKRPSVFGVPVYWSSFVPVLPGPTRTDIWFLKLGERHIHGIVPPLNGQRTFLKVRTTHLGQLEPSTRHDISWAVGIAVPAATDIFVIRNVAIP